MALTSILPTQSVLSPNYIINGNFDHWQRGTSGFTTSQYTADRYFATYTIGTQSVSRSTDVPDTGSDYSLQLTNTAGTNPQIQHRIESVFARDLAGKTVTFKFKWKVTDSTATPIRIFFSIPSTANAFSGANSTVTSATINAAPTANGWNSYVVTFVVPATAGRGLQVLIFRDSGAVATTTTTLFSQMQMVIGSFSDLNFSYATANYATELTLCQRYYELIFATSSASLSQYFNRYFVTLKRVTPTLTLASGSTNGADFSAVNQTQWRSPVGTLSAAAASDFIIAADAEL